jgi:hypothetical protein
LPHDHRIRGLVVLDGPRKAYPSTTLGLLEASARFHDDHSPDMDMLIFEIENKDGTRGQAIIRSKKEGLTLQFARSDKAEQPLPPSEI